MHSIEAQNQQVNHNFANTPQSRHLYLGQWVEIYSNRPNREQFNGMRGQVTAITNNDIIYVATRHYNPCFYPHELRPVQGGAA